MLFQDVHSPPPPFTPTRKPLSRMIVVAERTPGPQKECNEGADPHTYIRTAAITCSTPPHPSCRFRNATRLTYDCDCDGTPIPSQGKNQASKCTFDRPNPPRSTLTCTYKCSSTAGAAIAIPSTIGAPIRENIIHGLDITSFCEADHREQECTAMTSASMSISSPIAIVDVDVDALAMLAARVTPVPSVSEGEWKDLVQPQPTTVPVYPRHGRAITPSKSDFDGHCDGVICICTDPDGVDMMESSSNEGRHLDEFDHLFIPILEALTNEEEKDDNKEDDSSICSDMSISHTSCSRFDEKGDCFDMSISSDDCSSRSSDKNYDNDLDNASLSSCAGDDGSGSSCFPSITQCQNAHCDGEDQDEDRFSIVTSDLISVYDDSVYDDTNIHPRDHCPTLNHTSHNHEVQKNRQDEVPGVIIIDAKSKNADANCTSSSKKGRNISCDATSRTLLPYDRSQYFLPISCIENDSLDRMEFLLELAKADGTAIIEKL